MSILTVSSDFLVQSTPPKPIRLDGKIAREFVQGWHPRYVYAGFAPIHLLFFEHDDGSWATWFLDEDMEYLSNAFSGLPLGRSRHFLGMCCRLFDNLWNSMVCEPISETLDASTKSIFLLSKDSRHSLLEIYLSKFDLSTKPIPIPVNLDSLNSIAVIDVGTRRVPLDMSFLQQIFEPGGLQKAYVDLLQTGSLTWPSPIDGRTSRAAHAFCLGESRFAYRLVDERHNLTFYLIADEIYFRVIYVYVPQGQLALVPENLASRADVTNLGRALLHHVLEHGDVLEAYLQRPAQQVANVWRGVSAMHLGHVLWNDISGIGSLAASVPPSKLPRFIVFDAGAGPEMYGPLDEIFPELQGKVTRDDGTFHDAVPSLYRDRILIIKTAGLQVSRAIRDRINGLLVRSPAHVEYITNCRAVAEHHGPVILLGLRTENRTLTDLPGFCERLVTFLSREVGRATLVIDGHNSRSGAPDRLIQSHGEAAASRSPVEVEFEVLLALQRRAAGTDINIVSTIAKPLEASLAWGHHSAFFLAMWGAGLAKYRWVCNKPGLVITSRWNLLNHRDLRIYDTPMFQEDPAPMDFIDADAVFDRVDPPLLVPPGLGNHPSIANFDLDESAAFRAVGKLLDRYAQKDRRTDRPVEQLAHLTACP